ncbi:MAG: hypothetical protein ACFFDH_07310 [Promethearchaeota archaeon]
MELNTINSGQSLTHNLHEGIKCGICRNNIANGAKIYQKGLSFGVVCEEYCKNNSLEDLELMANLFMAYGGYFGMKKDSNYSLYKVLKKLTSGDNGTRSILELNINLLHQALLHGICPHQFRQGLKLLKD